jgi:hypothetical protein
MTDGNARLVRFDTMQMPINPLDAHQAGFRQQVLPVAPAIVGMETPERVRQDARIVRELRPYDEAEREALRGRIAPRPDLALESYKARR